MSCRETENSGGQGESKTAQSECYRGVADGCPDEYLGSSIGIDWDHVLCSLLDLQLNV